jgi:hypothetical protein
MDLREYALSLGRNIPEKYLEDIEGMDDRKQVLQYCKRFPMAAKPAPKKKAPTKKVKVEEPKGDE